MRRQDPINVAKHEKSALYRDPVTGKVSYEVYKYSKKELFKNQPIFAEPIMRFQDEFYDPNENALLCQTHIHMDKKIESEYERRI